MKVLIVEDSRTMGVVIKEILLSMGHDAIVCTDAETGLEAFQQDNFSLMILDWMLPGMDGLELCREIRSIPKGDWCFILMVTANAKPEDLNAVLEAGADDYLAKPVKEPLLRTRLKIAEGMARNLIQRKRAESVLLLEEARLESLLKLSTMKDVMDKDLIGYALEECVRLTRSEVGYMHFFNEDQQSISLYTWSKEVLKNCSAEKTSHYPLQSAGIWADCARLRRPVVHNDYQNHPAKKGYPEGHFQVVRHMSVPVFDGDRIVAITGVGNKGKPYDDSDINQMRLFMNSMWTIYKNKRSEAEEKLNEARIEALYELGQMGGATLPAVAEFVLDRAVKLTGSHVGFLGFLNMRRDTFDIYGASKGFVKEYDIREGMLHMPLDKAGYWAEAIRQKKPIYVNDYCADSPYKKGIPAGHIELNRFLSVPVLEEGEVVGLALVGNKEDDYNEFDVRQLSLLMDGMLSHILKKRADEELAKAKQVAEKASSAKSDFLAKMSHEIRTPINAIIGLSDILLDSELTIEQTEQLEMLQFSADSLLDVINDVLDISKIEAGKMEAHLSEFSLKETINKVISPLSIKAREKGTRVELNCPSNVPDFLVGDHVKLSQVMINLVGNAIKFSEDGLVTVGVETEKITDKEVWLRFSVTDTGIGIPEKALKHIFDSFNQADNSISRRFGGTGLGLAISHSLVNMMKGAIHVDSEEGKGSTFHFNACFGVSENKGQVHAIAKPAKEPEAYVNTANAKEVNILLAEDNLINQRVAQIILKKAGYRTTIANDGSEAVGLFNDDSFDLILMDIEMPKMNGYEATRTIRRKESSSDKRIPIIAMTAHALDGYKDQCIKEGMDDYISKPINPKELIRLVRKFAV
ncbi:MAG: response regulator [Thermodesulfovibrionales bacterium]|nr:response regulator [Thermodesulfovibrionales bacterium]